MRLQPCRENMPTLHTREHLRTHVGRWGAFIAAGLALWAPWPVAQAAPPAAPGVTLSANLPARQPVGTTMTFTGHATGLANPVYRFSVGSAIVRDYSLAPSFTWTPLH